MSDKSEREVVVCRDGEELAARAADFIQEAAGEAVRSRGRFLFALAGGSTPEKAYTLLARPERSARIDWARTYLFFGDERFVPRTDARSNYAMVQRSLLAGGAIPPGHVFPIPTDRPTAADSAAAYVAMLAGAFAQPLAGAPPCFDLILLGLGDDGHTASLFPGAAALVETRAWVTWSPPGVLPPPVDRITLTFPVLNAARRILFLAAGAKKAATLRDVLESDPSLGDRPAAGVHPTAGQVTWLIDEAAARLLGRPA